MIIFVDARLMRQERQQSGVGLRRRGGSAIAATIADPMTATPTNGNTCFPFAVNCRLSKTFFGVPRKCNHCNKLIVMTAGYACQFCRFRCHKRCTGAGAHPCTRPKLCSLSRLPSGDEQLFNKLLRENEINCNDVDIFPGDWASVLAGTSVSSPQLSGLYPSSAPSDVFTNSRSGSVETLTSAEPPSPATVDPEHWSNNDRRPSSSKAYKTPVGCRIEDGDFGDDPPVRSAGLAPAQAPLVDRIFRLFSWNRNETPASKTTELGGIGLRSPNELELPYGARPALERAVSPSRTPVDDFNETILEQLFLQKRSTTSSCSTVDVTSSTITSRMHKQLQWVKHIAGGRCAQSQDCVNLDRTLAGGIGPIKISEPLNIQSNERTEQNRLSSTWPLLGLHVNYEDADYVSDVGFDSATSSSASAVLPDIADHAAFQLNESLELGDNNDPQLGEWSIAWADLQFGECVLEGSNMRMFRGRWHGDVMLHEYAEPQMSRFLHDVHTLSKIRHENIALFMGASIQLPRMAVVSSIRKGDSLYDAVQVKQRRLSHQTKVNIAKQIAQGMGYLHAKGIVLQCLTSRNVYLECKVKICTLDYGGLTRRQRRSSDSNGDNVVALFPGQLTYISPELMTTARVQPPSFIVEGTCTKQSDIYAYGSVLYEMLAGESPFAGQPAEAIIWRLGSGQRQNVDSICCHVAMKSLIEDCWSPDASYRPSFTTILKELHQTAALHKKHSSSEPERLNKTGMPQRPLRPHPYPSPSFHNPL